MTEYVMVPKVATEEMAKAGDDGYYGMSPYEIWEIMLAAAPKWPSEEDVERAAKVLSEQRAGPTAWSSSAHAQADGRDKWRDKMRADARAVLETLGRGTK